MGLRNYLPYSNAIDLGVTKLRQDKYFCHPSSGMFHVLQLHWHESVLISYTVEESVRTTLVHSTFHLLYLVECMGLPWVYPSKMTPCQSDARITDMSKLLKSVMRSALAAERLRPTGDHGSSEGHEMLKRNDKYHSIADDVPISKM